MRSDGMAGRGRQTGISHRRCYAMCAARTRRTATAGARVIQNARSILYNVPVYLMFLDFSLSLW